jgi:hypothetical protein
MSFEHTSFGHRQAKILGLTVVCSVCLSCRLDVLHTCDQPANACMFHRCGLACSRQCDCHWPPELQLQSVSVSRMQACTWLGNAIVRQCRGCAIAILYAEPGACAAPGFEASDDWAPCFQQPLHASISLELGQITVRACTCCRSFSYQRSSTDSLVALHLHPVCCCKSET